MNRPFTSISPDPLDTIDLIEPVRIPDLPRVTTKVVGLDPAIWPASTFEDDDCISQGEG